MDTQLKDIIATRPRETSGAISANRFDFQKDWLVCLIIDLHLQKKDYLILCDYHEDIVVLDNEHEPRTISFFQIKTRKEGKWTITGLLKQKKGKKGEPLSSILGKLYSNFIKFQTSTENLCFISNASYKFKLVENAGHDSKIYCSDLIDEELKKIKTCLGLETGMTCSLPENPELIFETTPLPLSGHDIFAKGKLVELLDHFLHNKKHPPVSALYKTLFDEVRRKTAHEGTCTDFEELKAKKGICKSKIEASLGSILSGKDMDELWSEVRPNLVSEGIPALEINRIRNAWQKYEVDRMDPTNDALIKLRSKITTWCKDIQNQKNTLKEIMDKVCDLSKEDNGSLVFTSEYIKAMALLETYEIESI
ncbi:hypothetical protein BAC1_00317 [uncultured bacterium]|nr:hypothetical protein BAC1_00317 [uncultured bacterium]